MEKIAVLGAGSWATALAVLMSKKGIKVKLWSRSQKLADEINHKENKQYLPGVTLAKEIEASVDMEGVLAGAAGVIFAVPSHAFRDVLRRSLPFLPPHGLLINVAKGLEEDSLLRLSEVFIEEAGQKMSNRYALVSGPSHAEEVSRDIPTAVVCAGHTAEAAVLAQDLLMTENFRVYTSPDIRGVELGGALKNIIALGTGVVEGLGLGDNTKAALMTRGLAEITRLGSVMGANPMTFAGLAGLGDLIVTCASVHSRNRRAGIEIGRGKTLEEALSAVKMVVEGVRTTRAVYNLASRLAVDMPITVHIYRVLFEGLSPRKAINYLMTRERRSEQEFY